MDKRRLALLGRAFEAEVNAALTGGSHVIQPRGVIVGELVAEGLLRRATVTLGGRMPVRIEGYELTHAGRMAYCMSCEPDKEQRT